MSKKTRNRHAQIKDVEQGICPFCKKILYIADRYINSTTFECWNDDRIFVVGTVSPEIIKKCDDAYCSR